MQKDLAPDIGLSLPTYLPEGYFFSSGMLTRSAGESPVTGGIFSFTYQRGQDEWITLAAQSRNSTSCPDEAEYRPADTGTATTRNGGRSELAWGKDGWCFTLSGILSEEELEEIAASVKPVPYREGSVPPYEYQPPEHPLTGNYSFNRNATAQGITVTLEDLSCRPDMCTAGLRLGIGSPPAYSAPPGGVSPPVAPEPHAEWRVDGKRPLRMMDGNGGYRPEGDTTMTFWNIEPLPGDSRILSVNVTRIRGITGPWLIEVPLRPPDPQETP